MLRNRWMMSLAGILLIAAQADAGLYNSAEPPLAPSANLAEFLGQLASLRGYGPPDPLLGIQESSARQDYLQKVARLRETEAAGKLSAEEKANLGAYLIRLRRTRPGIPDFDEAIRVLEAANREHPNQFAILANLGTAYQLSGRLDAALSYLERAEALAPAESQRFEKYHLVLLQGRLRETLSFGMAPLDNLFRGRDHAPLRFVGENGQWQVGSLAAAERQKLPPSPSPLPPGGEGRVRGDGSLPEGIRVVQQLLMWLPDDGRLLWQYGELANAAGDIRTASEALHQAVYTYRLSTRELKDRRVALLEAAAWRDLLDRFRTADKQPDPEQQAAWVLRSIGAACQPPSLSWDPVPQATIMASLPRRAGDIDVADLFGGSGTETDSTPVNPFANMGAKGWAAITVGAAIILLLLLLQVREQWRRRRGTSPPIHPSNV